MWGLTLCLSVLGLYATVRFVAYMARQAYELIDQ